MYMYVTLISDKLGGPPALAYVHVAANTAWSGLLIVILF